MYLKEGKFEADFSQALQKRRLAATGSNFPPANTFIPTLCRCSHPILNTLFSFTGKLHSTFFRENAELTAELGAKAKYSRCWSTSLPTESCIPDLLCTAPWRASPAAGTQTRNCSRFAGLCPNLQQHKHHWILLGTEHMVRCQKLLPRKTKENQTKVHLHSFTGGTTVSHVKTDTVGRKM